MDFNKRYEIINADYKQKCDQLHNHLLSMWPRFNFILTFQGLLAGASTLKGGDITTLAMPIQTIGFLTSVVWYCLSANDRYLVKIYREHVRTAFDTMKRFLAENRFFYLADTSQFIETSSANNPKMNLLGWRSSKLGMTDYITMFPILLSLFWLFSLI